MGQTKVQPTEKARRLLQVLPPKRAEDTETAWADPWAATRSAREVVMGRVITDQIDADPAEVQRLRAARQQARVGRRYRRHDVS